MIPARRAAMKPGTSSAVFVGVSVMTTTGSVTITKPAGTQTGDYMMVFCPYGGASISGGTGSSSWNHDKFTNGHGYDNHCWHKKLTSSDAGATLTLSSVSYAPVICVVYRGPGRAVKLAEREDTGTTWTAYYPRGKSPKSMGWVQWLNDRNGNNDSSTGPGGWTKRTGSNYTGTFTGEVYDNLSAQPTSAGSATFSNYIDASGYIRSGYLYEFLPDEALDDLFWSPVIFDKTYSTAGTLVVGSSSFSFAQDNTGIRGTAHPTLGSTAIYELTISASASTGTNIGMSNLSWMDAWKSAYPSSVPGSGGGIYWTSTKGVGIWYGGGTHQSGSETGTTSITGYTTMNPTAGDTVGIVMNGRNIRAYLNGTFYGELALSKDSGTGTNRMGGDLMYPFLGQWGGSYSGSFRSTKSGYFSSYKLNS